jgi:uncharacterized membrane protein YbhN (UPF0104 family)
MTPSQTDLAKPPILPRGVQGWLWLATKIVVSGGILGVFLSRIDFTEMNGAFATLSIPLSIAGLAATAGANCLGGYRWSVLTQRLDARIPPGDAIGMYIAALFMGQVLPSTLGVDAVRGWLASRKYRPAPQIIGAIVVDRAFGMLGLGFLMLLGAPMLLSKGNLQIGQAAVLAIAVFVIASAVAATGLALLLRANLSGRLAALQTTARTVLTAVFHQKGALALALSVVVHGLLVISIALFAAGLGAPLAPQDALAVVPAALLISTIPITINGWGLRESAMVAGLSLAGVPASLAFIVSILFGIAQFVAAAPGAAYWIFARKGAAR